MNIEDYLKLMHFPKEWEEWNMLPDSNYINEVIALYEPGNENASEHDRNGFFHWWLRKEPTEEQLVLLIELAALDPEKSLEKDLRKYIEKSKNSTELVMAKLQKI